MSVIRRFIYPRFVLNIIVFVQLCHGNDILGCGGFVKSHANLDFSKIEIGLYTKEGSLKEKTECAPTNGYYFLPIYEKGDYFLKIHPPAGWSFEPSQVDLSINGVDDECSRGHDINFSFNGFGITGQVVTAGEKEGPSGITVQLIDKNGNKRDTLTSVGGDFHFTPVIPGKYTVKASHPRWKLDPSEATVQVKEGNTALALGSLAVRGYDVKGSVHTDGNPISGLYVLLYSKEENPKLRIEGCKTALLQGVPDAPICYSITDSAGEFTFGLVPAGEYKLLALAKTPGQTTVTYDIRPETVKFTVKHDSLFIKNAFEVSGFSVSGLVLEAPDGRGVAGARVWLDGAPAASSDAAGRYTLPPLRPGQYTLTFEHEQAQFDPTQISISPAGGGSVPAAAAARWRACGAVRGGPQRAVALSGARGTVTAAADQQENWCTFLPPGVYTAKVEVSEQEQRDGLQFYPLSQTFTVGPGHTAPVVFSQLKATLRGAVRCLPGAGPACAEVPVTCRPLSPDGEYVGKPITTHAKDGQYKLEGVLPGSAEVAVGGARLCWAATAHNVPVAAASVTLPDFQHAGYAVAVHSTHDITIDYTSATDNGTVQVSAGRNQLCVKTAGRYTLRPRSCHRLEPAEAVADTSAADDEVIYFVAVAHEVGVVITSPKKVDDLTLKISSESGIRTVGPLAPQLVDGQYEYTYTLHMAEGEVSVFTPTSATLLFRPGSVQLAGGADCRAATRLRAEPALVLAGELQPPVAAATVTLTADDLVLVHTTGPDGTYRFGPLEAGKKYKITAEKESYSMSEPDNKGVIFAKKLAEIHVLLRDEADGTPLEGALVSVSGGSYRRTLVTPTSGRLQFPSLAPGNYYLKPHMKEYRFTPPSHTLQLAEGATHTHTISGVRVACRALGRVVSLSGAARARGGVQAAPAPPRDHCPPLETRADDEGNFRLRGLAPGCAYRVSLRPDAAQPALALAHAPLLIEVKEKKDIEGLRLIAIEPNHLTDTNVLIYTPLVEHYKTLRLKLALEESPSPPLHSTRLDSAGYTNHVNPGLMYPLPRLPADNKTYVLSLESTLSKATHSYEEQSFYFTSDGSFKYFDIQFLPKVVTSEQELRQSGLIVAPVMLVLAVLYQYRAAVVGWLTALVTPVKNTKASRGPRAETDRADLARPRPRARAAPAPAPGAVGVTAVSDPAPLTAPARRRTQLAG